MSIVSARTLDRRTFMKLAGLSLCASGFLSLSGCGLDFSKGNLRSITDMGGRRVSLPEQVDRVFCTNPIGTVDVFGLAPEKLAGWNFRPAGDNKKYIPDEYFALPSLGVWMGAGAVPNAEEIAAQNPDALLCFWTADEVGANMAGEVQNQTGLPVVLVDYDVRSAPTTFRFLGDLMGCSERAEELALYCEGKLATIRAVADAVPESERRAYFPLRIFFTPPAAIAAPAPMASTPGPGRISMGTPTAMTATPATVCTAPLIRPPPFSRTGLPKPSTNVVCNGSLSTACFCLPNVGGVKASAAVCAAAPAVWAAPRAASMGATSMMGCRGNAMCCLLPLPCFAVTRGCTPRECLLCGTGIAASFRFRYHTALRARLVSCVANRHQRVTRCPYRLDGSCGARRPDGR